MSLTARKFNKLVEKAKKDEDVLVRSTHESAVLYGVSYKDMSRIRSKVRFIVGTVKSVEHLRELDKKRRINRIERNLQGVNETYPGMLAYIYTGEVLAAIGRKYNISRQRVHQIKTQLDELIEEKGLVYVRHNVIYKK